MIPAVDVKFLQTITTKLKQQRPLVYKPGAHRSAAALILRFAPDSPAAPPVEVSKLFSRFDKKLSAEDVIKRLENNQIDPSKELSNNSMLHLLFLKKADMAADRWSGQIAFPGGLRDPEEDADDFAAVVREAREELGIPLDAPDFIFLGRMQDYVIQSRHVSLEGLTQARFVFLHIGDMTPTTTLARHEVESVQWFPLSRLQPQFVDRRQVVHHIMNFANIRQVRRIDIIKEIFPGALICFPSVALPPQEGTGGGPSWRIWGLTLRSASELLELRGTPPLDWPPYESTSFLFQNAVINAFLGYRQLTEPNVHDSTRDPFLLVCFASVVMVGIALIYFVSYWIYTVTTAVLMVFDILDPDHSLERKKAYYQTATIPTADQSMQRVSDYRHSSTSNVSAASTRGNQSTREARESDAQLLRELNGVIDRHVSDATGHPALQQQQQQEMSSSATESVVVSITPPLRVEQPSEQSAEEVLYEQQAHDELSVDDILRKYTSASKN